MLVTKKITSEKATFGFIAGLNCNWAGMSHPLLILWGGTSISLNWTDICMPDHLRLVWSKRQPLQYASGGRRGRIESFHVLNGASKCAAVWMFGHNATPGCSGAHLVLWCTLSSILLNSLLVHDPFLCVVPLGGSLSREIPRRRILHRRLLASMELKATGTSIVEATVTLIAVFLDNSHRMYHTWVARCRLVNWTLGRVLNLTAIYCWILM